MVLFLLRFIQLIGLTMKMTHTDTTFTLTGQYWTGTYPLTELLKWLQLYRKQREDFPKAGTAYDAAIEGLEALTWELSVVQ